MPLTRYYLLLRELSRQYERQDMARFFKGNSALMEEWDEEGAEWLKQQPPLRQR